MNCKYGIDVDVDVIHFNLKRITSQTYRLLPTREEGDDWVKPLETLIVEIAGMNELFKDQVSFFTLLCKMQGMIELSDEIDFRLFRRSVFECCSLLNKLDEQF